MNTYAQLQFVTPDGRIADIPGSSGIIRLPDNLNPVQALREARKEARDRESDAVRIVVFREGRALACGAPW